MAEFTDSDPVRHVEAFIAAMNKWEMDADAARRRAESSGSPESCHASIKEQVAEIFRTYCTDRERPYGRVAAPSFQRPPEYDPAKEKVVSVSMETSSKAFVETEREAVLGGGRYRYVLHRRDGKWRIDNLKVLIDGKWEQQIL